MKSIIRRATTKSATAVRPFLEPLEQRLHLASQPYNWNSVTIKGDGFIDGIVYSPAAQNVVFMHTDMGGAYRWDQTANKWMPMTDWVRYNDPQTQFNGVESLAVHPTDPNKLYMLIGTYMSTTAMMRSSAGGRTWARTNVPFTSNGTGPGRNAGERLAVDPNSPGIL